MNGKEECQSKYNVRKDADHINYLPSKRESEKNSNEFVKFSQPSSTVSQAKPKSAKKNGERAKKDLKYLPGTNQNSIRIEYLIG